MEERARQQSTYSPAWETRRRLATVRGGVWTLLLLAGLILLAPAASSQQLSPQDEAAVQIGRLHYDGGGDWYSNPSSMPNWMRSFEQRTGIRTFHEERVVRPEDEELYDFPIVYMNGHGTVEFSDDQARNLREWMQAGGLLWADDNYGLDATFRREVQRLFPQQELRELPNNHPLYRSFYRLPGLPKIHEHDNKPPQALVITDEDRILLLYTYESDIGDGLEDPDVHKDPPEKREAAMRMAVNIMMYALTH
jgi:hypothetical protein